MISVIVYNDCCHDLFDEVRSTWGKVTFTMKTLIAYYSFTENNEKLAVYLQKRINCDIVKIETIKSRNSFSILFDLIFNRMPATKAVPYSLKDYDHVIFLAPIWAGKIAMPMKSFLVKEKTNIPDYSFITMCGGGNPDQKQNIRKQLSEVLQKDPLDVVELWVSKLFPEGGIKPTSAFRIEETDLDKFQSEISSFLREQMLIDAI